MANGIPSEELPGANHHEQEKPHIFWLYPPWPHPRKSPWILGVTLRKDLNWNLHINNTCNKANKALGFLWRNLRINSMKVKQQAYFTYAWPILDYCSSVWDPYRASHIDQLEMVQCRAARFACNRYRRSSSMGSMLEVLQWKSLQDRRAAARLAMFYKMQNGLVSTHPTQYLVAQPFTYKYFVPHPSVFFLPTHSQSMEPPASWLSISAITRSFQG